MPARAEARRNFENRRSRAELYLKTYNRQMVGDDSASFPFESQEDFRGTRAPLLSVNRVFYQDRDSPHGHRVMYDFRVLAELLRDCDFGSVARRSFREGADSALLIDAESRAAESLYVEAS